MYISRLEIQKSNDIARSLDFNEIETLLQNAESDMATALNFAGMKGLKEIGKTPIIQSSLGTADEINCYRLKRIIQGELNLYLTAHYLYNSYTNGRYAINVLLYNETLILSPDLIAINATQMRLERPTLPLIGPRPIINHTTYWVASVPIEVEIRAIAQHTDAIVTTRTLIVSSILTSRYPLLQSLTQEYHQTINGTFSPLWTLATAVSNIYSLIRGYKHYRTGMPQNIVDNRHLSVLINSGLFLEQSLVFSSVDPLGLVELARKTKQLLQEQPQDPLSTFNKEMNGDGYDVRTDNLTKGSANVDAGDPMSTPIDDRFSLNLSEVAQRILYNMTGVTLTFENDAGDTTEKYIVFDENTERNIREAVEYWENQSYVLVEITKHLQRNETTCNALPLIASMVYHDELSTKVTDRLITAELLGDPGPGWTDAGAGPWDAVGFLPLSKQEVKPALGHVFPGCALYEEIYNVTFQRAHFWYRYEERNISGNITLIQIWNNVTDMHIETVVLQEILDGYAAYNNTQNDVIDVLYYNATVNDPNLEDTLDIYLVLYPDSHPLKQQLLFTPGNQGTMGLNTSVPGFYDPWVLEESWDAFEEILSSVSKISLDPSINETRYPDPVLLFKKATDDFLGTFLSQIDQYLNHSRYQADSLFYSVGKKTVYYMREWFVSIIKASFETVISRATEELTSAISSAIPLSMGCTAQNISDTLDNTVEAVRNQFTIPFGLNMTLSRYNDEGMILWDETVRLAVDQQPNYLDPFETITDDGEELWTMKLRNRCIFGPTGLPILPPTPATPWLMTLNLWVIDVEGEYGLFKIIDASDETIFNPLIGHEPQSYVREAKVITVSNITLGENTRLSFGFTTVAFGLVPPWGMMVGDIQENWPDDHTPGFDEEG